MKTRGFGLVELVVVMAIVGFIASIAILSYQRAKAPLPRIECFEIRQDGHIRQVVSYEASVTYMRLLIRTDPKRPTGDFDYLVAGTFEARITPCDVEATR